MDDCGTDLFTDEFETEMEAIKNADTQWNNLTEHDKRKRNSFYVLKSIDPDTESIQHFDGDVIKQYK